MECRDASLQVDMKLLVHKGEMRYVLKAWNVYFLIARPLIAYCFPLEGVLQSKAVHMTFNSLCGANLYEIARMLCLSIHVTLCTISLGLVMDFPPWMGVMWTFQGALHHSSWAALNWLHVLSQEQPAVCDSGRTAQSTHTQTRNCSVGRLRNGNKCQMWHQLHKSRISTLSPEKRWRFKISAFVFKKIILKLLCPLHIEF